MDNEKNNENIPESSENRKDIVIENFGDDDELSDGGELDSRYAELMNSADDESDDDDEDDIAAVAERITGERHSQVSTAAPIRIRSDFPQSRPMTSSIPVRREQISNHSAASAASVEHKPAKKLKRTFRALISAILLTIIALTAFIVIVHMVFEKNEKNDVPDETNPAETDYTAPDANSGNENQNDENPDTALTVPEAPETQAPETIPEPESEPEPIQTFSVTLDFYDREDIVAEVSQMTLGELYDEVGYTPRDTDRPSVGLDYVIAANATITIDTLEYKTESVSEAVPYGSDIIELDTIPRGSTNYINGGVNGEIVRTYTVEYVNGTEQNRTLQSEETTKWAVNEKYELGVGGSFVGSDGVTYTYSHRRTVPATYYSIEGLTYLGTYADESVIAVDPDNIPLGTRVYVKNDTYDFGVRIASDVGPKVEEWEVDIWLSASNPQYASFAQIGYHYDMEIFFID